jgi:D-sedoheptulose 7-phosphate isomerase
MIKNTIEEISNNFLKLSENCNDDIKLASEMMVKSIKNSGKIIFCGNGGSAADSQHLSAELIGRYRKNRNPIAAIALTTDTSIITAVANDFSFNEIFSRQVEVLGKSEDILYAISTSGKSKNVIKAIEVANTKNIKVIGITGESGGDMNDICDLIIKVPAKRPDRIQELHIAVGQILCEIIENAIYPDNG